jgi:branched-chain amino acid transport system substrate-binding protein
MVAAGTTDDVTAIRAAFPKAFPLLGDKFPIEMFGISDAGRIHLEASVQMIKNGKYTNPDLYVWWLKSEKELDSVKKISKVTLPVKFMKAVE